MSKSKKLKKNYSDKEKKMRIKLEEKHKALLLLIYKVGGNVMLEKQLKTICFKLRLGKYTDEKYLEEVIRNLETYGLITTERWQQNTRLKVIILRAPFIAHMAKYCTELLGYPHSRVFEESSFLYNWSTVKSEYIINMLHPNMVHSTGVAGNIDAFLKYISDTCSMFYQKGRGQEYLTTIYNNWGANLKMSNYEFKDICKRYSKEASNLVSRQANGTIIKLNNNIKVECANRTVGLTQQKIEVKIDIFNSNKNISIDSIGDRIRETLIFYNTILDCRMKLIKPIACMNCKKGRCIEKAPVDNSEKGLVSGYYKYISCSETPLVLDRVVNFKVNIYAKDSKELGNMRKLCDKSSEFEYGITNLQSKLLEGKYFSQGDFSSGKIVIEYKNLEFDYKYLKGKRGEQFSKINSERALNKVVEIAKSNNSSSVSEEIVKLVQTASLLSDDMKLELFKSLNNTLENTLKELEKNKEEA